VRNRELSCNFGGWFYPVTGNIPILTTTAIPTTQFFTPLDSTTTSKPPPSFFDILSNPVEQFIRNFTIFTILGTGIIRKGNNIYNFAVAEYLIYFFDTNWVLKSIMEINSFTTNFIIAVDNQFYVSSGITAGLIHTSSNLTILHTYGDVEKYNQLAYDPINNTIIAVSGGDNKIHIFDRNLNILNTIQTSLYYISAVAVFGSKIFVGSSIKLIQVFENGQSISVQKIPDCSVQSLKIDSYGYMILHCGTSTLYLYNVNYDVLNYDRLYMDGWYINYGFELNEHYQNMSKNLNSAITGPLAFDSQGRLTVVVGNRLKFFSSVDSTSPATTPTTTTTTTTSVITTSTMITTTTSVITTSTMITTKTSVITTSTMITTTTTSVITTYTIITTNETIPPAAPTNAGEIVGVCTGGFSMYPNTNITICNKDSLGLTRQASEVTDFLKLFLRLNLYLKKKIDCQFPFQYNGVWYDVCTNIGRDYFWCSIDSIYENRFAPCAQECPALARIKVQPTIDWNGFNQLHATCLNKGDEFTRSLAPDQTTIDKILDLINSARSNVSPTAIAMPAIRWDTRLARIAQRKSDSCQNILNCWSCSTVLNYGPSVYVRQLSYLSYDENFNWTKSLNGDLGQKKYFTYSEENVGFGLFKIKINITFIKLVFNSYISLFVHSNCE
jgi:hypothetical protein